MSFGGLFIMRKTTFFILAMLVFVNVAWLSIFSTEKVSAKGNSIKITINGDRRVELKNPPLLQNGSVYLPLREIGTLLNSKTTWVFEGKRIIVNRPTTKIEMKLGSKEATVNGKPYLLQANPKNENGVVYVPARFVTEALGAQVEWFAKEQRVNLKFNEIYLFAEKSEKAYWLNIGNGKLYLSADAKAAELIAVTKVEIKESGMLTIDSLSERVDLLSVHDNYGEPHLGNSYFKMVLVDNKMTLETKVQYYGLHPIQDVEKLENNHVLLMDGPTLYEVDSSGLVIEQLDLQALTGNEDTSYLVDLYDDQYIVIRPHDSGLLTLIDRKSKKSIRLADVLLDKEKLDIYKTIDKASTDFTYWDGLTLLKRDGDYLKLSHQWFLDGLKTEYSYKLSSN